MPTREREPVFDVEWFRRYLPAPRFQPYLEDCAGNQDLALRLYWWNVEVSAALYPGLHFLEIFLRNALHEELAHQYARADWWATVQLAGEGGNMISAARRRLERTCGRTPNSDDVVAAMPFGFWVSLLSRSNETIMWRPALYRAFRPGYRGSRSEIHRRFERVRRLRNRVMHHEPVHMRYLEADHQRIYELAECLAPGAANMLQPVDELPVVLARRPVPFLGRRRSGAE
jgi:hypothetical protein